MRVLLIDQHFWPDMPGYFVWNIGRQLVADGHEVHVLTMQPSYNSNRGELRRACSEVVDGMSVIHMPTFVRRRRSRCAQLASALLLCIGAFVAVLARPYTIVRFGTVPPVMLGVAVVAAARMRKRRPRLVYHCQDIYPEVLRPSRHDPGSPLWRMVRKVDTVVARGCDAIVTLSSDMARTLEDRGIEAERIAVINNPYVVEPAGAPIPGGYLPEFGQQPVAMFAGNLGRFQNLEQLVEAAHVLSDEPMHICFVGEGAAKACLQRLAGPLDGRSVHFLPLVPPEVAFSVLQRADVAVISLASDVHRAAYPSKTMTALAAGCRLVVVVERHSELVRTILAHDLGSWSPPDDPTRLAHVLMDEVRVAGPEHRRRAWEHAHAVHSPDVVLPMWTALFEQVTNEAQYSRRLAAEAAA